MARAISIAHRFSKQSSKKGRLRRSPVGNVAEHRARSGRGSSSSMMKRRSTPLPAPARALNTADQSLAVAVDPDQAAFEVRPGLELPEQGFDPEAYSWGEYWNSLEP